MIGNDIGIRILVYCDNDIYDMVTWCYTYTYTAGTLVLLQVEARSIAEALLY